MRFLSMLFVVVAIAACGPELEPEPSVGEAAPSGAPVVQDNLDQDFLQPDVSGSVSGYIGSLEYFNSDSYSSSFFENGYVSKTTIYTRVDDRVVMTQLRFHDGMRISDLEPGAYVFADGSVTAVGCYGFERDVWTYDNYSEDITLHVSDTPEGRTVEYQFVFTNNLTDSIVDELSGVLHYSN